MLTKEAFNALLKTLEEPPPHVKFIFATTEIRKLPVTVLSRCQRFDLRRIGAEQLVAHFASVAEAEGVKAESEALKLIAGAAEGSARDGLSLLAQAIAHCGGQVAGAQVRDMLGLADRARIYDLFEALMKGDVAEVLAQLREQYDLGADPEVVLRDLLELPPLLTRLQVAAEAGAEPALSKTEQQRAEALAKGLSMPILARTWQMLLKGLAEVRTAPSALAAAEMILIRLAYCTDLPTPLDAVRQVMDREPAKLASAPTVQLASPPVSEPTSLQPQSAGSASQEIAVTPSSEMYEEPPPSPAPTKSPSIDSLAGIGARVEVEDVRLYHHLMVDVTRVEFRPGHLEICPGEKAPADLANNLRGILKSWTGETWTVVVNCQAEGKPPLAEQQRQVKAEILVQAENDPLVKAVLETFPGAKVTDMRPLGRRVNAVPDMNTKKDEMK